MRDSISCECCGRLPSATTTPNTADGQLQRPLAISQRADLDVGVAADVDAVVPHVRSVQEHVAPPAPVSTKPAERTSADAAVP